MLLQEKPLCFRVPLDGTRLEITRQSAQGSLFHASSVCLAILDEQATAEELPQVQVLK